MGCKNYLKSNVILQKHLRGLLHLNSFRKELINRWERYADGVKNERF